MSDNPKKTPDWDALLAGIWGGIAPSAEGNPERGHISLVIRDENALTGMRLERPVVQVRLSDDDLAHGIVETAEEVDPQKARALLGAILAYLERAATLGTDDHPQVTAKDRLARQQEARRRILEYGDEPPLTTGQTGELLHLGRAGVWERKDARALLGLPIGPRRVLFPAWQFDLTAPDNLVPGLRALLGRMPVDDPWGLAAILVHPQRTLQGRVPIEELASGGDRSGRAIAKLSALLDETYSTAAQTYASTSLSRVQPEPRPQRASGRAFNEWLRAQLKAKKMSQRQLAEQSGVDPSTISRLIRGDRMPTLGTATKLARGLRELGENDDGRQYLGIAGGGVQNPPARVEYALRSDERLKELQVRQVMEYYLAVRMRFLPRVVWLASRSGTHPDSIAVKESGQRVASGGRPSVVIPGELTRSRPA